MKEKSVTFVVLFIILYQFDKFYFLFHRFSLKKILDVIFNFRVHFAGRVSIGIIQDE